MPNVALIGYGLQQPSFRHRMQTLVAPLQAAGWQVRCEQFPSGRYGLRTWERRSLWKWADVGILHQIKLSALEARLFAALSRRCIFDVDDAIYVRKPRSLGEKPDESQWRKRKFFATCRLATVVAAGNDVLAGVARDSAREIVILPTSIDVELLHTDARGSGWSAHHSLDRQSGKSHLPGYAATGPGAAEPALPEAQAACDLLEVSSVGRCQRGVRGLEFRHRGAIPGRRAYRCDAIE